MPAKGHGQMRGLAHKEQDRLAASLPPTLRGRVEPVLESRNLSLLVMNQGAETSQSGRKVTVALLKRATPNAAHVASYTVVRFAGYS